MKTRILTIAFLLTYTFSFSQVDMLFGKHKERLLLGPENVNRILPAQKEHYIYRYTLAVENINSDIHDLKSELLVFTVNNAQENKTKKRKIKTIARLEKDLVLLEEYIELWTEVPEKNSAEIEEFYKLINPNICYKLDTPDGMLFPHEFEFVEYTSSNEYREIIPVNYITTTGKWVRKKKSPNCFSQNPDDCYIACYVEGSSKPFYSIGEGALKVDYEGCPDDFKMSTDETHCYRNIELETDNNLESSSLQLINLNNGTAILDIFEWTSITCE